MAIRAQLKKHGVRSLERKMRSIVEDPRHLWGSDKKSNKCIKEKNNT